MQKTKLGISVGLLGSAVCFMALFGGYIPTIILVGYILLMEDNAWLKRNSVKAISLSVLFSITFAVIGLVPDFFSWINSVVRVFNGNFNYSFISSITSVITIALDIIRTVVFLLLGYKALNQGTVNVSVVDNLINKCM